MKLLVYSILKHINYKFMVLSNKFREQSKVPLFDSLQLFAQFVFFYLNKKPFDLSDVSVEIVLNDVIYIGNKYHFDIDYFCFF